MWRRVLGRLSVLAAVQCKGAEPVGEARLLVAGNYEVSLEYRSNTCPFQDALGSLRVAVRHTPDAPTLTLVDGNATFAATIDSTASFRTTPLSGSDGRGNQLSGIQLTGRFTRTGFDADLGVNVLPPAGVACRYVISWTGRKLGPDNVIP